MESIEDRAERHSRILARLAEAGMAAVEKVSARLEAAETDVEVERLVLSLHRVSRCVRLTLALESQLAQDSRRALSDRRFDRAEAGRHRRKQVFRAVIGRIYAERDDEAGESLRQDLSALLDEHELYEEFLDRPLEAVIEGLCRELGLAPLASNDAQAQTPSASDPPPRAAPSLAPPSLAATGPP